jgi:hypothetical protein
VLLLAPHIKLADSHRVEHKLETNDHARQDIIHVYL